jgi:very-short-patch-repair endonuclease
MDYSEAYKNQQRRAMKFSIDLQNRATKAEKELVEALIYYGIYFKFQSYFFTEKGTLYLPDFIIPCETYKLVVEVDGGIHERQKYYDDLRTKWLIKNRNCKVIRFTNEQVLQNIDYVIEQIQNHSFKAQEIIDEGKERKKLKRKQGLALKKQGRIKS